MDNLFTSAGLTDFLGNEDDEEEYFNEGIPGKGYFDATTLPDVPVHQRNAHGTQTYVLHVCFPTREELKRALIAFTFGNRKSVGSRITEVTINGVAMRKSNNTFLEIWENKLLDTVLPVREIDPDEASEAGAI